MKNTYLLIIVILVATISSCGILKKDDGHNEETMQKTDAYALAYSQCNYELALMQHRDSTSDVMLKIKYQNLKEDLIQLKQTYYLRYNDPEEKFVDFQELVKKVSPELTVCKKLEEYKILKVQIESEKKEGK